MNHHLVALSRGKVQTRRKYAHGEARFLQITEYLALVLNNRIAALKTAQDIKAFHFIMAVAGSVNSKKSNDHESLHFRGQNHAHRRAK